MPQPMTKNNYELIANKVSSVAKEVAEGTMNDAVQDLWNKNLENSTDDIILDTGASCDGTWQRRSFSSNNGVFAAISFENGKVLNVEPMSKGCMQKNDLQKKKIQLHLHIGEIHIYVNLIIMVLLEEWKQKVRNEYLQDLLIRIE